ncbi:MAG: hypothetical protein OEY18_00850 [Candidatus Aminicenantes bacterium]|nr:hypothetical protein [Candidatus Aminicenantes bacterium]MDH5383223.1 hypothetical protein [Candidatus Aminicenantes bacterium]
MENRTWPQSILFLDECQPLTLGIKIIPPSTMRFGWTGTAAERLSWVRCFPHHGDGKAFLH